MNFLFRYNKVRLLREIAIYIFKSIISNISTCALLYRLQEREGIRKFRSNVDVYFSFAILKQATVTHLFITPPH